MCFVFVSECLANCLCFCCYYCCIVIGNCNCCLEKVSVWFLLLLLNVPVNSYGHVGVVISNFVGPVPGIEMNDTQSSEIKHRPSK